MGVEHEAVGGGCGSYLSDVGDGALESLWHRDAADDELQLGIVVVEWRQSKRSSHRFTATQRQLPTHTHATV